MAQCDICGAEGALIDVVMQPRTESVQLCETCAGGLKGEAVPDGHWQALTTSMWSVSDAVKVVSWRLLNRLKEEGWAADALDMLYLEPEVEEWAKSGGPDVIHRDSLGAVLSAGDTVVLIKDLPVKGGGFTAKRGTAVRGISLVPDNAGHIEGRVEGQRIVILTEFVKKR
ncbi:alkylphosphonate utilization protein [Celeribacter litoreus]|uniref:alkylphosphonate utilization protein n=1 Tax=Celeribacter litoreus TaxID=2876714 RepID=UPI001CC99C60|nr:alkylphosphonate utilization protein [Celeribacter litoreus]MCA0042612.1 alkylphosphonate utilization protein [Celeribacter litoreus]